MPAEPLAVQALLGEVIRDRALRERVEAEPEAVLRDRGIAGADAERLLAQGISRLIAYHEMVHSRLFKTIRAFMGGAALRPFRRRSGHPRPARPDPAQGRGASRDAKTDQVRALASLQPPPVAQLYRICGRKGHGAKAARHVAPQLPQLHRRHQQRHHRAALFIERRRGGLLVGQHGSSRSGVWLLCRLGRCYVLAPFFQTESQVLRQAVDVRHQPNGDVDVVGDSPEGDLLSIE